jgi:16S rRNA (guanine527-N7)-methyltransferase
MPEMITTHRLADIRESIRRDVSRETFERLEIIVAQLEKWQPRVNLVSSSTMGQIWQRHIYDSLQLIEVLPDIMQKSDVNWIDLGSGGGFPGLVIAAGFASGSGAKLTMVESNAKKCAFLRETSRIAGLPVQVINQRIEDTVPKLTEQYDLVSARALASLQELLSMTAPLITKGTVGIFPKGQDVDDEIKSASISWNIGYDLIDSQTEPGAKIVVVKFASRLV